MKRRMSLVSGLLGLAILAGICAAGERYGFPLFTVNYNLVTASTTFSRTWTNAVGEKLLLKGAYLTAAGMTNGSMIVVNSATSSNYIPVSAAGNSIYTAPAAGSVWIEPAGTLVVNGLIYTNGFITNNFCLTIFASRPE
jgi:hypothetical protein